MIPDPQTDWESFLVLGVPLRLSYLRYSCRIHHPESFCSGEYSPVVEIDQFYKWQRLVEKCGDLAGDGQSSLCIVRHMIATDAPYIIDLYDFNLPRLDC